MQIWQCYDDFLNLVNCNTACYGSSCASAGCSSPLQHLLMCLSCTMHLTPAHVLMVLSGNALQLHMTRFPQLLNALWVYARL